MSYTPTVIAFAGSLRKASFNKKLVKKAAEGAQAAGAIVTVVDLREFPMPLYDGDIESESGIPDSAMALKKLLLDHDGLLISSPEYNSSITAALKNAIDWTSRKAEGETPGACYRGKVTGLMSASPGRLGGLRALPHLRAILTTLGCLTLPEQIAVGQAASAFDAEGNLVDERQRATVERIGANVVATLRKLHA